ncbi:copper amine oxidase N-terminal domain-containing protein [Paenibacillus marinisediminis]
MKLSKAFKMIIIASLVLCSANVAYASNKETVSLNDVPALLQINEYHVLYTYPKPPYIDNNYRLMIPLRAVSEMLGAQVSYSSKDKQALIEMNGSTLSITADSKMIEVDGTPELMDTVPVIYEQSMFIPVRVLIDHFNLPATRDPMTGIVNIQSKSLMESDMMKYMNEYDKTPEISSLDALVPSYYDLQIVTEQGKLQEGELTLTSMNMSRQKIEQGKEDMHVIFMYDHGLQMELDIDTTDQVNKRNRPALKADAIFKSKYTFYAPNYTERLKYILAIGRTFK